MFEFRPQISTLPLDAAKHPTTPTDALQLTVDRPSINKSSIPSESRLLPAKAVSAISGSFVSDLLQKIASLDPQRLNSNNNNNNNNTTTQHSTAPICIVDSLYSSCAATDLCRQHSLLFINSPYYRSIYLSSIIVVVQ
jgi:hypothetical protein